MSELPVIIPDESRFMGRDREQSDESLRRAAGRARTEDEHLETLREAGSLALGIAAVYGPQRLSDEQATFLAEGRRRRNAEDAEMTRRSHDYYTNTPEGRAAAARVAATMRQADAAYRAKRGAA